MAAAAFGWHDVLTLIQRLLEQLECFTPYRLHMLFTDTSKTGAVSLFAKDRGSKEGTGLRPIYTKIHDNKEANCKPTF